MQKKYANSRAAEVFGITISEVHAARRQANYADLREWNLEQARAETPEK
jgi:hypothetical protein